MATVTDTLITRYQADSSHYESGTNRMLAATRSLTGGMGGLQSAVSQASVGIPVLVTAMAAGAAIAIGLVAAIASVTEKFIEVGAVASRKAAEFDALVQSLEAVVGSAEKAAKRLRELKAIGALPGISLSEAIQADTSLQRSGVSSDLSLTLLRELANQNAMAGGGAAEFGRMRLAATQIATKPFLQGDEMLQLMEAGVPAPSMLKSAFGTSDPEELKKMGISGMQALEALAGEMAKTARVGNTAKNTFENLGQAIEQLWIQAGSGINEVLMPAIDGFSRAIESISSTGVLQQMGENIANDFQMIVEALTGGASMDKAIATVIAGIELLSGGVRNFWIASIELVRGFAQAIPALLNAIPVIGPALGVAASVGMAAMWSAIDGAIKGVEFRMEAGRKVAESQAEKDAADAGGKNGAGTTGQRQTSILQKIATNTEPLLDMRRASFGGGDLAARGISAVEISGLKSSKKPEKMIAQAVGMMLEPMIQQALRLRGAR